MTIGAEEEADAIFQEEENARVKADVDARLAKAHALAQSKAHALKSHMLAHDPTQGSAKCPMAWRPKMLPFYVAPTKASTSFDIDTATSSHCHVYAEQKSSHAMAVHWEGLDDKAAYSLMCFMPAGASKPHSTVDITGLSAGGMGQIAVNVVLPADDARGMVGLFLRPNDKTQTFGFRIVERKRAMVQGAMVELDPELKNPKIVCDSEPVTFGKTIKPNLRDHQGLPKKKVPKIPRSQRVRGRGGGWAREDSVREQSLTKVKTGVKQRPAAILGGGGDSGVRSKAQAVARQYALRRRAAFGDDGSRERRGGREHMDVGIRAEADAHPFPYDNTLQMVQDGRWKHLRKLHDPQVTHGSWRRSSKSVPSIALCPGAAPRTHGWGRRKLDAAKRLVRYVLKGDREPFVSPLEAQKEAEQHVVVEQQRKGKWTFRKPKVKGPGIDRPQYFGSPRPLMDELRDLMWSMRPPVVESQGVPKPQSVPISQLEVDNKQGKLKRKGKDKDKSSGKALEKEKEENKASDNAEPGWDGRGKKNKIVPASSD